MLFLLIVQLRVQKSYFQNVKAQKWVFQGRPVQSAGFRARLVRENADLQEIEVRQLIK
jgi:hypothetical protein